MFFNGLRWRSLALAGLLMCGAVTTAYAVTINQVIGVNVLATYSSAVFVGGSDGNVWLNTDYGGTYHWQQLTALNVSFGVGVESPGSNPAAYAVATNGDLYEVYQSGSTWTAGFVLAPPSGVALRQRVGTCSNSSNQPFLFILGSDGNIWLAHYAGSWTWTNIAKPSGVAFSQTIGVVNVGSSYPQIFILGSDGNVWHASWNGSGYPWDKVGKPTSLNVSMPLWAQASGTTPEALVVASNGQIWQASGSTGSWGWAQVLGVPTGGVTFGIGVPPAHLNEVVVASDAGDYINHWVTGTGWSAYDVTSTGVFHAVSPVGTIDTGQGPFGFYIGGTGHLVVWEPSNQAAPLDLGVP